MIQAANKIAYKDASVALMKPLEAPAENQGCLYPDLVDEASILEWAGVSLGRAEIYRLYLSIKALADSIAGDNRARFFGKIYTRGEPYYVVEMNSVYEGEEEIDPKKQEGKEGANKYTYFVSQNIEAGVPSWTKLPEVKAAQVVAASQFKRYLTGDLEAPVPTFPVFDGVEKNLLRAQIARIAGATSISPDGFFEIDLSKWDIAAGGLLIKEAGGIVSDFSGKDDWINSGNIIASTPKIYEPFIKIISKHLSKELKG